MKRKMSKIAAAGVIILIVASCGRGTPQNNEVVQAADGGESGSIAEPQKEVGRIPEVVSPLISSSVSTMESCDAVKVVLQWNTAMAHPSTTLVKVWVGSDQESGALFIEGGPSGTAETGAWVLPGTMFRLTDSASGAELASIVVGGPDCK